MPGEDTAAPAASRTPATVPSIFDIQKTVSKIFHYRPCRWQCEVAQALLRGDKDIVCISGTGSGKTLPFWIPLLHRRDGIQVIVTPLNILGSQNRQQLEKHGISAISIVAESATHENIQDILNFRYRVVTVNPETALKPCGIFESVWRDKTFLARLISVVWDEAHLMTAWASFRPELGQAETLRNILSGAAASIPFLLPSATMPRHVLNKTVSSAGLRKERLLVIHRSNDRPNVYLTVRKIRHAISSYKDLDFLIPDDWSPDVRVPRFIVFFDNKEQSIQAAEHVRSRLPFEHRHKVLWFNSDNTAEYRDSVTADFKANKILGLFCTDAFGMGVDIPDIDLIVQWRTTCNLDSLSQRFGRAARDLGREGLAVIFVESKFFDEEKEAALARQEKRRETFQLKAAEGEARKRKRTDGGHASEPAIRSRKRQRGDVQDVTTPVTGVTGSGAKRPVVSSNGSSSAALPQASLSVYESLRVQFQMPTSVLSGEHKPTNRGSRKQSGRARSGKADVLTVDGNLSPEMDSLVNAATRPFRCYRKLFIAYYENDRIEAAKERCENDGDISKIAPGLSDLTEVTQVA